MTSVIHNTLSRKKVFCELESQGDRKYFLYVPFNEIMDFFKLSPVNTQMSPIERDTIQTASVLQERDLTCPAARIFRLRHRHINRITTSTTSKSSHLILLLIWWQNFGVGRKTYGL